MGLAEGTAKYLLFFFNLLFFISGILILSVGAIVLSELTDIEKDANNEVEIVKGAPIVLITIGSLITVIAFFGCCGAIKSNYCMLMTFSIILVLIFIIEFAAGIAAYVKKDDIESELDKWVKKEVEDYIANSTTPSAKNWDLFQTKWECCGYHNYSDYIKNATDGCHTEPEGCKLPSSCCPKHNGTCTDKMTHFKQGCVDGLTNFATKNITKIGAVGVGIAFIQILGIVLACCLATAVKHTQHV